MTTDTLDGLYGRAVTLDLCHACGALWFDGRESLQLTPGAVIELFARIHAEAAARQPLAATALACPRCARGLLRTTDQQRSTRFSYWRCGGGHGRFITFAEFLREKNFVRPLDARELAELRSHVHSVRCSSCGAGIDLERGSECTYCRSPVSMLDPGQVEKMLRGLHAAETERQTVDPELPARLAMDRLEVERLWQQMEIESGGTSRVRLPGLLEAGIAVVANGLLGRRR